MPFKIVQTFDKNQDELCICPAGWESHGSLYWPRNNVEKLIKIEDSLPTSNWLIMQCVVRKKRIPNYDIAEKELEKFLDTTHEQPHLSDVGLPNFNDLTNETMEDSLNTPAAIRRNSETNHSPTITAEDVLQVVQNSDIDSIVHNQKVIHTNQKKIIDNQKFIKESLKQLIKTQNYMMIAITEMSEKLNTTIAGTSEVPAVATSYSRPSFNFTPIQNVAELTHLENILQDDHIKEYYKSKYSVVCGMDKALNCAYKLCDIFFSRRFLTQCSWAGGCRGEGSKVTFKTYKNILNLFFELVYECDRSYTIDANEKFFKTILRNSYKRSMAKLQRTSTCKTRSKRKKISEIEKKTTDNIDILNEDDAPNIDNVPDEDNSLC